MDTFEFGPYRFDSDTDELSKNGKTVRLHPQPARLLRLLLSRAGDVVPREAIRLELWDDDVHVDVDLGINSCIKQLRAALGDDIDKPLYVQTVPRKGYRFIASVTTQHATKPRRIWLLAGAVGALVLLAVAAIDLPRERSLPTSSPFTSYEGEESYPAFSPDGDSVAFIWRKDVDAVAHLYIKRVDGGDPLQLTHGETDDCCPAWSPDGSEIAFVRDVAAGHHTELVTVPVLGGPARRLTTSGSHARPRISWSPDGTTLMYSDRASGSQRDSLFSLSLETGTKTQVSFPTTDTDLEHWFPVYSPDGRSAVFFRGARNTGGAGELVVKDLASGRERLLVSNRLQQYGADWTADGRFIIYSAPRGRSYESRLWKIDARGGEPERLPFGENATHLSVSRADGRLIYSRWDRDYNLWRVSGPAASNATLPERFLGSTRDEIYASYSPDGSRIAFVSDREGGWELRVVDTNGENPRSIVQGTHYIAPRWSPTGEQIGFHSAPDGEEHPNLYVVDADGGVPREITPDGSVPTWSPDGDVIYFQSRRSGRAEIWSLDLESGETRQLTQDGGTLPGAVVDGRVYYMHEDGFRLWSVSVDGGDERPAAPERVRRPGSHTSMWSPRGDRFLFLGTGLDGGRAFGLFDPRTAEQTMVVPLPEGARPTRGLSISPDGKWILYSQNDDRGRDLVLVDGVP